MQMLLSSLEHLFIVSSPLNMVRSLSLGKDRGIHC
jgi:hypothetical protein